MPNTDLPPIPITPAKDEVYKLSFWVSQLFILAATVLGVYLAASVGFKQALAYGDIQSNKNNYYLRLSLKSELQDNVELVKKYAKSIETGGFGARHEAFRLDTFVWESLRFSGATLETPSELLAGSRNFYRQVADTHEKVVANSLDGPAGAKRLRELAERMEKEVLPQFDRDLSALKQKLAGNGIAL